MDNTAAGALGLMPFKVAAQAGPAIALLVARNASDDDLTKLVRAIQKARSDGTLDKLIPATTPRGSRGPYAIVNLFVMSDPQWATEGRLKQFVNSSSELSDFDREFGKRILAYYFYTSLGNDEEGSLGFATETHKYTGKYAKLF